MFVIEFALATVLGLAIFIMSGWHLWSVGKGETSVESQDNVQYRRIAKSRGKVRGPVFADYDSVFTLSEGICEFL